MFKLKIKTDNSAFDGNKAGELARILAKIASSLEHDDRDDSMQSAGSVYDENGNVVGHWTLD